MDRIYDWSGVIFLGGWTNEEAEAFATRVEQICVDELAAKVRAAPSPDDDEGAA